MATNNKLIQDYSPGTILYYAGGTLGICLMLLLIFMLAAGDRFADILSSLGLYNETSGVYADCSRPENRYVSYCQAKRSNADRTWKATEEKLPFNL